MAIDTHTLRRAFISQYGREPRLFRAPGRVNLIGEHTDYNQGFVLPAAIDRHVYAAVAPRSDGMLHVSSQQFSDHRSMPLEDLGCGPSGHWSDHIRGIAALLQRQGISVQGADLYVAGDLPLGGGLSSSAALEIATALALLTVAKHPMPLEAIAVLAQRAEHEFAGTQCGIMDQFISLMGREQDAMLLDCRSLERRWLPLPDQVRIVICDSMVKHHLAGSEYNRRRADCEEGVRILQGSCQDIRSLRDVDMKELEQQRSSMPAHIFRRCRHVVTENSRTLEFAHALELGDLAALGALMDASHKSLRNDYEVSCRELDLLVEIASGLPGVYGARMTGGGFGGCTVNLVNADHVERFSEEVRRRYRHATSITPTVFASPAVAGAAEVF